MILNDLTIKIKRPLVAAAVLVLAPLYLHAVSQTTVDWANGDSSSWIDHAGNVVTIKGQRIQKLDAGGVSQWTVSLSSGAGFDFSHHLVFDSANNLYIDGWADDRLQVAAVTVVKITATGNVSWNVKIPVGAVNTSEHMSEGPLLLAPNGSLYVVGHSGQALATHYPTTLFRIDPSNGAVLNRRTLTDTRDISRGMMDTALAADLSSNIYYGQPAGLYSFTSTLGTERWPETTLTSPVRAIAIDIWNNIFVTGGIQFDQQFSAMYVARLNSATGATVWNHTMQSGLYGGIYPGDGTLDNRMFGGNVISVDSRGFVWAAGRGASEDWDGGLIGRFEAASGALWFEYHYGSDFAGGSVFAMALDVNDYAYVGGRVRAFNGSDTVTGTQDIISPNGSTVNSEFISSGGNNEEPTQIAIDKNGRVVSTIDTYFDSSPTPHVTGRITIGRIPLAIGTSGNGKSKILMDTWNHQNILLSTFSSSDILQANPTSYSYGTYGRRDVALSCGPDNNVRVLQQLDSNGTTSAAISVLLRNDAGAVINNSVNPVINLRAVGIAIGSDNKSYVLVRSTTDGSCQLWRTSATGAKELTVTFAAQNNKVPVAVAVDGTSLVYLVWQGLDGQIYPWRLNTSLVPTNLAAFLDPQLSNIVTGAAVGADHQLRLVSDDIDSLTTLYALNSSGGLITRAVQGFNPAFSTVGLSVGVDNRSHLLWRLFDLGQYKYSLANSALNQISEQNLPIPLN